MYTIGQMFTSTEFVRSFALLVKCLRREPQHVLITHKSGQKFVFVPAEIFDDLMSYRLSEGGTMRQPASLREIVLER